MGNKQSVETDEIELATVSSPSSTKLLNDICILIDETHARVATSVNVGLTMLYWKIGERINVDVLQGKRADYGNEVVSTLSKQLGLQYGKGFSAKSIRHMMKFSESFANEQIVSTA